MSPYTVRFSTEVPADVVVSPSDVSPDYFLARLAEVERENPAEQERQRQLAKYDGPFGDGFFLFDIIAGLGKIGFELPQEAQTNFVDGLIDRDQLLSLRQRVEEA